ncbi:MAG: hypothetical protein GWN58_47395, partial [Anaerolineae bacterium]|nr:hypothetical protein [Anaerolineae bacterium]
MVGPFTSGGALTQAFTYFAVAKLDAGAVNDNKLHYICDGDDNTNRAILRQTDLPTPDAWNMWSGTNLTGGDSDGNWNIWTAVFNGNSSAFWLNGGLEASGAAGALEPDGLTAGAAYGGIAGWWEGDIAEIIIYDSELSDADKDEVGQYLAARYNLTYTNISVTTSTSTTTTTTT